MLVAETLAAESLGGWEPWWLNVLVARNSPGTLQTCCRIHCLQSIWCLRVLLAKTLVADDFWWVFTAPRHHGISPMGIPYPGSDNFGIYHPANPEDLLVDRYQSY